MTERTISEHSSPELLASPAIDDIGEERQPRYRHPGGGGIGAGQPVHGITSLTAYGVVAALLAALLPLAFSPSVFTWTFTPKYALLLIAGAIGVVPLVRLAKSSRMRNSARFAMGFLAAALLSALLSKAPNLGIFGLDTWGTAWLFWFGCAGAFAIGASLKTADRPLVMGGLLFGGCVNAVIGIYQVIAVPPAGPLYPYDGTQADGLLGNPIHLEALLLGCLALIATRTVRSPRRWWPMVVLLSVGLELTLERFAVVVLLLLLVMTGVTVGAKRALPLAGMIGAGYLIGYFGAGSGLAGRVTSSSSEATWGLRIHVWESAVKSLVHHPFLGVGPGQTIAATAPRMTAALAHSVGPGALPVDAHNFLVEVLVTTGLVGFALFGGWLFTAGVHAAGPFLACAVAMLAVELVEPLNVGITPLAFLALGVASVGVASGSAWWRRGPAPSGTSASDVTPFGDETGLQPPASRRVSRPAAVATAGLVAVSLIVGVAMVAAESLVYSASSNPIPSAKLSEFIDASRLAPYWPDIDEGVAGAYQYESVDLHQPGLLARARPWSERAARADPADPVAATDVGNLDLILGRDALAAALYHHALHLDPWTVSAFAGLAQVAAVRHMWGAELHFLELEKAVSSMTPSLQDSITDVERRLLQSRT